MPIDAKRLGSWIQPQHFAPEAVQAYQEAFLAHPGRLVILRDVLVPQVAERLAKFLSSEAQYQTEYGLYSVPDKGVPEQLWLGADEQDRFFRFSKLTGVQPEHQFSPNALSYLGFRNAFDEPAFREFFETVTGLALKSANDLGSHSMRAGDFLRAHDDASRNRRLAIVFYLSPRWEPVLGGAIHVIDATGAVTTHPSEYNSMIAFDVLAGTQHYVERIAAAAGDRARLTIGGWYHQPD